MTTRFTRMLLAAVAPASVLEGLTANPALRELHLEHQTLAPGELLVLEPRTLRTLQVSRGACNRRAFLMPRSTSEFSRAEFIGQRAGGAGAPDGMPRAGDGELERQCPGIARSRGAADRREPESVRSTGLRCCRPNSSVRVSVQARAAGGWKPAVRAAQVPGPAHRRGQRARGARRPRDHGRPAGLLDGVAAAETAAAVLAAAAAAAEQIAAAQPRPVWQGLGCV